MRKWWLSTVLFVPLCYGQAVHVHPLGKDFNKDLIKNSSYVIHERDNRHLMTREKEFQQGLIRRAGLESKLKTSDYWEIEELLDLLENKSLTDIQKRFQLSAQEVQRLLDAYYE